MRLRPSAVIVKFASFAVVYALVATLIGAQSGEAGAGGGAGGNGSVLPTRLLSQQECDAFAASLTEEEHSLFQAGLAQAQKRMGSANRDGVRQMLLSEICLALRAQYYGDRQKMFADLKQATERMKREENPAYIDDNEKRSAADLPKEAGGFIDIIATDTVIAAMTARKRLFQYDDIQVAAALRLRAQSVAEGPRRWRLLDLAEEFTQEKELAALWHAAENAQMAAEAQKVSEKECVIFLLSRQISDCVVVSRSGSYAGLCYYSFPKQSHGYKGAVSLLYGNGEGDRAFQVNMYGGQENEIVDLGETKPSAGMEWEAILNQRGLETGMEHVSATPNHWYAERLKEDRNHIDTLVFFRVCTVTPEYVIIAFAP
jgi:hypothetical protein